jgi:uncharacterized protein
VIDEELKAILVCPACKGDLRFEETRIICPACRKAYPIRDGIPVMLIDEAEAVDDAEHERLLAEAESQGIRPTFEAG